MTSPEERIRELARKSTIDEAAAAQLLAAVRPRPAAPSRNPFERLSPAVGCAGVVCVLVMLGLGRLNVRSPGTFDILHVNHPVGVVTALLDQVAAYPLSAIVVWGIARLLTRSVRPIDVLAALGLGRVPLTLVAVPLAFLTPAGQAIAGARSYAILVLALLGLGGTILLVILGVRTATGLQAGKLTVAVAGGLIAAELVSKVFLSLVTPS